MKSHDITQYQRHIRVIIAYVPPFMQTNIHNKLCKIQSEKEKQVNSVSLTLRICMQPKAPLHQRGSMQPQSSTRWAACSPSPPLEGQHAAPVLHQRGSMQPQLSPAVMVTGRGTLGASSGPHRAATSSMTSLSSAGGRMLLHTSDQGPDTLRIPRNFLTYATTYWRTPERLRTRLRQNANRLQWALTHS